MAVTINASTTAGLVQTADTSGILALQTAGTTAVSISASQAVTLTNALAEASGGTGTTVGYNGLKNRIINGAMTIWQKATSVTGSTGYNSIDRYDINGSTCTLNVAQSTDVPSTAGFVSSTGITVGTASSASGAYAYLLQMIEGYNWADMRYGTSAAQTSTLSFWVKSSIAGTYGISFRNTGSARFYTTTYTISSANTWEYKTITITGDTSGTWLTTNGIGFQVIFDLGVGTTYSSTSNNAWSTVGSNYFGVTGVTKLGATAGATFYLTGVQLEKGSTATSFDYRPYGTELALCQRYYYLSNPGNTQKNGGAWGSMSAATTAHITGPLPVPMRAAPTYTFGGTSNTYYISNVNATSAGTPVNTSASPLIVDFELSGMSSAGVGYPVQYNGQLSITAEL